MIIFTIFFALFSVFGASKINSHNSLMDDLKPGTKPLTIFIPGPFGMRKGPRAVYNLDFKTKSK